MNTLSIVIFDWDDTLYPTSAFQHVTSDNLAVIDNLIAKIIHKCLRMAKVIIITNAAKAWIDITMASLPKTQSMRKHIEIISARDMWSNSISDIHLWKKHTFKHVYDIAKKKRHRLNIMSIGDAEYEYNALVNLHNDKENDMLKTIKFKSSPSYNELCEELEITYDIIDKAIKINNHIDWNFS
jgi:hypothetical protein